MEQIKTRPRISPYAVPGISKEDIRATKRQNETLIFKNLVQKVCRITGTDISLVYNRGNKTEIVLTRFLCMYYAYYTADLSKARIGQLIWPEGKPMNHGNVIRGIDTIRRMLSDRIRGPHAQQIVKQVASINELLKTSIDESNSTNG